MTGGRGPRLARAGLIAPAAVLLISAVAVPILLLGYFGLLTGPSMDGPVTGAEWVRMVTEWSLYGRLLGKSILIGLAATLITIVIGFPAAWAISRHVRRQGLALTLIVVPSLTSSLLLIYAVFVMIAPGGIVMEILAALHLADAEGGILYTKSAVIIMLAYMYLPLMIIALFATVERIDVRVLQAARSLGAGAWQRLLRIILPLSLPGLLAGLVIVFTPVTGSFIEAKILGGTSGMMFGTLIEGQLSAVDNQPRAAAMSLLLLLSILAILLVLHRVSRWWAPGALRRRV